MTFAAQLQSLAEAVVRGGAASRLSQAERLEEAARKRRRHRKVTPIGPTADEKREAYRAAVLLALKIEGPLRSSAIGSAIGASRLTAYKRLLVLEDRGQVVRIGSGVKTKWRLP